jgi:hypothetical protein
MLMQMMPSAEAIGQDDREASRTIGARTFVTSAAFIHAATLSRASGSGSEGWKTRLGDFSQNERRAHPSRLRFRG